jgi:hypothetical protein
MFHRLHQDIKLGILLHMRTTLTLDRDVAESLKRLLKGRGVTMKALINDALRVGLTEIERPQPRKAFRTKAVSLKPRASNIDDVAEVLALAEGDDFR